MSQAVRDRGLVPAQRKPCEAGLPVYLWLVAKPSSLLAYRHWAKAPALLS